MSVLEVRNLKKSFDAHTVVLRGVDFSLEKGETIAIIGSSGSGKTTLLRCLNFLTVPDEGQIVVNDETLVKKAVALARAEGLGVEMLPLRTTAEDFGFYTHVYPSLFYRLGVGRASGRSHTATFLPDERALAVGEEFMYELALNILNK